MRKLIGRILAWYFEAYATNIGVPVNGRIVDLGEFIEHTRADFVNVYQELLLAHKEIEKLRVKRDAKGRFVKGGE